MILGVNGIRLIGMRSGVGRAIEAFLKCMGEMDHPFTTINVYTPQPLDDLVILPDPARNVVLPSRLHPGLWEQIVLLKAHGAKDVLFCPSYVMPIFARCPTLLAHHGSYEGYKDAAQAYPLWTRVKARVMYDLSAHRATIVSTVSEYSKQDMAHYYRLAPEKIQVIPEGVDTELFRPIQDPSLLSRWRTQLFGQEAPFILYVGKPTRRRNLPNLLRAFQRLKQEHKIPHKLLLVGSSLPGLVIEKEIQELGLREHVVELGYASHEELVVCYNACDVFIYPSSYEGFGMPVLEAMACGTPVIALNNTAFPEFAGGVARLLPDANVDTLADGITQLLFDREQRETMAREGPRRAKKYDWHIVTGLYLEQLLKLAIPENAADPLRLPDL